MKRSTAILLFFIITGLIALASDVQQHPDERCAIDGTPIEPLSKVEITLLDGIKKRFCSLCCAQLWFSDNEKDVASITLTDELTGEEIDRSLSYMIESNTYSRQENRCQIHAIGTVNAAADHLLRYEGKEVSNYFGGITRLLPWALDFRVRDTDGKTLSLRDFQGKIVFLRFWNISNPYTKKDMKSLALAHQKWEKEDFTVLVVNVENSPEQVREYLQTQNLPFPVLLDPDGRVADKYAVKGFPTGFLIDRNGIVRKQITGEIPTALFQPLIAPLLTSHR